MLKELRKFWNKHIRYRNVQLTPKGESFRNYCKQIFDNSLKDEIEAYEDFIWYIQEMVLIDYNIELSRKESVELILKSYEEIL